MREEFRVLLSDRVNRYGLFLSLGLSIAGLVFFLIKVWSLPPFVPLFYNRPWGFPQLATPIHLLLLLLGSLAVLSINLVLALKLHRSIVLLSRILLWVSVLTSLLATTTVVRVSILIS